ncbi:MAG: hypothetical protein GY865_16925 [candidate division Zixibacteria bacterium]|nr:hypothetical protein [candidate division Zixibacteria bacterium]
MDKSKVTNLTTERDGKTIKADSLCATCNDVAICSYIDQTNQPVIFCEEFESSDAPQIRLYGVGEAVAEKSIDISSPGLCVNCENISACNYSKENTPVLHCEEYV